MTGPVRLVADDLTGAADAGVTLVGGERAVLLTLGAHGGYWRDRALPVVALDSATRDATASEAAAAVAALAGDLPEGAELVAKIDSALRGHVGPEVVALREVLPDHLVVVAPAFPANRRVTLGGVQHVGGLPLHLGDLWALEAREPPESVAALLSPMACRLVGLDVVRGAPAGLRRALVDAGRAERVAICDAETDGDLDRLVVAARAAGRPVVWVGAAGLAAAVGRADPAFEGGGPSSAGPSRAELCREGPYLAVIGSAAAAAQAQADVLASAGGAASIELDAATLAAGDEASQSALADRLLASVAERDTVVRIVGPLDAERSPAIVSSLAAVTAAAASVAGALVLTGGATARAVLDAAGTKALRLVGELDPGIVLARPVGRDGVPVITKSGAFGDDRTLLRALQRIPVREGSSGAS